MDLCQKGDFMSSSSSSYHASLSFFAFRFATALYQSQLFEIDPAAQRAGSTPTGANADNNGHRQQVRHTLPASAKIVRQPTQVPACAIDCVDFST
jgi:hypothetical protein